MNFNCECGSKGTLRVDVTQTKDTTEVDYNCKACGYKNKYVFGQNKKDK